MKIRTAAALSLLTAETLFTGGCAAKGGGPDGVIDYWLWDATQQPGYQACADAFEAANPGLNVRITQYGWDDYWSKLTAEFIADQAPDVFTNHLTKYAQFVDLEVLVPLDGLEATRDITDAAGVTREWLMNMDWNPDDGGSFEKDHRPPERGRQRRPRRRIGIRQEQRRGLRTRIGGGRGREPRPDPVGCLHRFHRLGTLDKNPWGTHFNLDDPSFQKTMAWYFGLVRKGYMPSYETFGKRSGSYQQVARGKVVPGMNGSPRGPRRWSVPARCATHPGWTSRPSPRTSRRAPPRIPR